MKIYAICEGEIDDQFSLTLINNPDLYENASVMYTNLEEFPEVPTLFYEEYEILDYWTPYNGTFRTNEVYGKLDEDDHFELDELSDDLYAVYSTYRKGELIDEEYEKL